MACKALILFMGSYVRSFSARSRPAGDNHLGDALAIYPLQTEKLLLLEGFTKPVRHHLLGLDKFVPR